MREQTELNIHLLDSRYMRQFRETIKLNRDGFIGTSYIWIQYKDESIFVLSNDEIDEMPSLNMQDILFITTWFSPCADLFLNPKLSRKDKLAIIEGEMVDEDGVPYYGKVNYTRDFKL